MNADLFEMIKMLPIVLAAMVGCYWMNKYSPFNHDDDDSNGPF